jgi:hypothetical protein
MIPGILPRFAIGRPSISSMSAVKSIGSAEEIACPIPYASTEAP